MPPAWRIWLDTGGTFTDGVAHAEGDPPHRMKRVKVLSSGALRGRIKAVESPSTLTFTLGRSGAALLLTGFQLRLLQQNAVRTIVAHYPAAEMIRLDAPLDPVPSPGALFEVSTGESAVILASRLLTGTPAQQPLPAIAMRLATTRGTNALLQRSGAATALFVTEGFEDLLEISDQQRPDLFALNIIKRLPFHRASFGVRERLAADGATLTALDEVSLLAQAKQAIAQGIRHAAVAFLHSYVNPAHEQRAADLLRSAGFTHVSCSSELAPMIELLPRAETAVVDAYLAESIKGYLADVSRSIPGGTLHVMTSAGGFVQAARYRAKDSLLSGPAGGVAGAAAAGRASGFTRLIAFDMGGTSTDVARIAPEPESASAKSTFEYRFEQVIAGARILAPALAIETVAAGGGSICAFQDDRLRVGPTSAGADPGPACYGAGGPLTLTDVNLLLGRLDPAQFEVPIDRAPADARLKELVDGIASATNSAPDADALLEGFLNIVNERMAGAIESISLRKGYDPADHALVSFGGAGGQHACAVASMLGMKTVIMPPDASLLSAIGLGSATIERFARKQAFMLLDDSFDELHTLFDACEIEVTSEIENEGVPRSEIAIRRRLANLRLAGQDATIAVDIATDLNTDAMRTQFAKRYEDLYGHAPGTHPIEVESIGVLAAVRRRFADTPTALAAMPHQVAPDRTARVRLNGAWTDAPVYHRSNLKPGAQIGGPALIFDRRSSYLLESGWTAQIDAAGAIVATRSAHVAPVASAKLPEVVRMELFTNRFASIAEDMGHVLQRASMSTNVKRRLDFSCAVLDASGELVVNAPHIPVHLGALGMCVRAVAQQLDIKPGDVIITNHPAYGGSHLPDITVITPVHMDDGTRIGYVANRAHHAEIGGTRPGSMPPLAKTLAAEGVVIPPMHLLRLDERGNPQSRFDAVEQLLREAPDPSRAVEENLADLRAAMACNKRGAASLLALAEAHGYAEVDAQMKSIKARAAKLAADAITSLGDRDAVAEESLDDGSILRVRFAVQAGRATIDFTGTSPQHAGNLNATPAIVRSAVLYVLRLLIGERLPLNEGIMQAVEIVLPRCLLNPDFTGDPSRAPAVVGGNTETSQRLVDTLLKALGIAACSQGTMNNVLFGSDRPPAFGYYETVCGGAGAGPTFDGANAVHTHMTNTRITDPEVIERRHPVRIERFAVRRGSGGKGTHRGGDGVVREYRFLEPVALSILSQHRVIQPYGMNGGQPGAAGRQRIIRANGEIVELRAVDQRDVETGDRLILETPGGGGFGA